MLPDQVRQMMLTSAQAGQRAAQGGQPPQGYTAPRPMPLLPAQGNAARQGLLAQALRNRGGYAIRPQGQQDDPRLQPQQQDADELYRNRPPF
jgi:hypothetical protein